MIVETAVAEQTKVVLEHKILLTLTPREAMILFCIVGQIGGPKEKAVRKEFCAPMYDRLEEALKKIALHPQTIGKYLPGYDRISDGTGWYINTKFDDSQFTIELKEPKIDC